MDAAAFHLSCSPRVTSASTRSATAAGRARAKCSFGYRQDVLAARLTFVEAGVETWAAVSRYLDSTRRVSTGRNRDNECRRFAGVLRRCSKKIEITV
jgi:hypothetical protein